MQTALPAATPQPVTAHLLWRVADDTLSVPIGLVADVAVGPDDTVYLLDTQNAIVRRIDRDGHELPPLGRAGEGPGEFTHPRLVAVGPGNDCVVIQDFHEPAVCLKPDGGVCAAPDLSIIRSRFLSTLFMGTARIDARGRLLVVAATMPRVQDATTGTASQALTLSVFRFGPADTEPAVLFTDGTDVGSDATVRFRAHGGFFIAHDWDVTDAGTVVYASPDGTNRVIVGHPVDGRARAIDLPAEPSDDQELRAAAKRAGESVDALPRIAGLYYIGSGRLLVAPGARASAPTAGAIGTFEMIDSTGTPHGRRLLRCDYDSARDAFFIRRGILVVIGGGRAAMETSLRQMGAMLGKSVEMPPAGDDASDTIRVHAYDLGATFASE